MRLIKPKPRGKKKEKKKRKKRGRMGLIRKKKKVRKTIVHSNEKIPLIPKSKEEKKTKRLRF